MVGLVRSEVPGEGREDALGGSGRSAQLPECVKIVFPACLRHRPFLVSDAEQRKSTYRPEDDSVSGRPRRTRGYVVLVGARW